MTTEHAEAVPEAGDLQRYPTTRELVNAALAHSATLGAEPTPICPNYAVPCEDLDGNPHQLVVVALGGRIALVGPGDTTTVLHPHAVEALDGSLHAAKLIAGPARIGWVQDESRLPRRSAGGTSATMTARLRAARDQR
jgi:hypothetical protein